MKIRILAGSFALLLAATSAFAVTDTWDGGGADDNISTGLNWVDNTAPASDLNNTDLIFAGSAGLAPNFTAAFSADSVTFNSTAGLFQIDGLQLTVGAGGITNNDTQAQRFSNVVSVGTITTTAINATSGPLEFFGGLDIPVTRAVTLGGSNEVTILKFGSGTGTLNKSNPGPLTLGANPGDPQMVANLLLNAGTTTLSGFGFTMDVGSTGLIAVGAGATLDITSSDLTLSNGGQLTKASGGTVNIGSFRTLRIESGSDFVSSATQTISNGFLTVTGAGSTIQATTGVLQATSGGTLTVQSGGSAVSAGPLAVANGTLTVDGTGSSASAATGTSIWGQTLASAVVTFSNNASGSFTGVAMAEGASDAALVQILSGADITNTGSLALGISGSAATLLVSGAGTTWQQTTAATTIGADSFSASSLTVSDGAAFTTSGAMTVNATGTVTLDGGTLSVGGAFSSSGTFNFTAGALSLLGSGLTVGTGGQIGQNLTLAADRELTVGGTTTVDAFRTLTLDGGSLSTGALVNNGTFAFNKGTLTITSILGLNIGTGGLGSNVTLGTGMNLAVNNTTGINSGATLRVDGGSFSSAPITNNGTIDHRAGAFSFTGNLTNNSGGRIFIADTMSAAASLTNSGTITLQNGTGQISGAIMLTNNGLLTGDGTISTPVTNASAGQIRAEAGKTIYFTGTFAANAGELNLQGGTLDFAGAVTNSVTGFIAGRGALYTGGLTNNGQMAFSGANADIHGDVTLAAGSRVTTSGAGTVTTFFDDVVHNGTEIFTGASGSTVFFGNQSGAGPFTGAGTVYYIGDLRPGNSPANVNYGGDLVFGGAASLTLEIGGLTPGSQYDRLTIAGSASLDGILKVSLINGFTPTGGQQFTILTAGSITNNDFALAGSAASLFNLLVNSTSVILQAISAVVPGDFDSDGDVDGADFVAWQTNFPKATGATLAQGDADADGDVDGADFVAWQTHFPYTPAPGASPVPEPAAGILLVLLLLGVVIHAVGHQRRHCSERHHNSVDRCLNRRALKVELH